MEGRHPSSTTTWEGPCVCSTALAGPAEKFAAANPDTVALAVSRVGQEVDRRTGGRYRGQIDKAGRMVAERIHGQGRGNRQV